MPSLPPYITLEKVVGETPLACVEAYRGTHPELIGVPLAYAGRLDPMASGKLLILVGDECKRQTDYHNLDKTYEFSVLFGLASDTGDVLGRLTYANVPPPTITADTLNNIANSLVGEITLPYPTFSAKTVAGKPLHLWTLENRLHEITIPTKTSTIYSLSLTALEEQDHQTLCTLARNKIDTIPPITEVSKALGQDFRRTDIRADWAALATNTVAPSNWQIASFTCTASSGTYMRTLAEIIAARCNTAGLAWHIHRSTIGVYTRGGWQKVF